MIILLLWRVLIIVIVCGAKALSINASETSVESTARASDEQLVNCNTYITCTQCVSSSFPCDWCVDGHRCTHDTAENCRNDILVTGVSRIGPSYRSGPGFCPTINSTSDGTNEILVPSGVKRAIKVKVHIIGQFIVQTRFVCQFNIEGRVTHVNAQLFADTIYCEPVEFTYTSRAPNITPSFAVIWGGSKPLDNPNNVHIVVFSCRNAASTCDGCRSLKFACEWCTKTATCEVEGQCTESTSEACPAPEIVNVDPTFGPQSGGTILTIKWQEYDVITGLKAFLGDVPCAILSIDRDLVKCRTSRSDYLGKVTLRIQLNGSEQPIENPTFEYIEDPVVDLQSFNPKGILSGGIKLEVSGAHLQAVKSPRLYVYYEDQQFISPCRVSSFSSMVCESPGVQTASIAVDPEKPLALEYGFYMDDVQSVQNLSKKGPFQLYPDPVYEKFDDDVKYYKSDYLTINGQHLDRACQVADVEVHIGEHYCNVTSLARHQLTCRPPTQDKLEAGVDAPEVVVRVGRHLEFRLGRLNYTRISPN